MDYRDNPAYRAAMREIERRSLAMSRPGVHGQEEDGSTQPAPEADAPELT